MKVILTSFFIISISFCFSQKHPPKFALDVYNTMFASMSDGKTLKPYFVLSEDDEMVAEYSPRGVKNKKTIYIGHRFIEIARNFGKDSSNVIAHVLGHELAHVFLHQYEFLKDVGSSYASVKYSKDTKKIKSHLKDSIYERQADEHAVFFAYISGYQTTHIGALVLDSIYKNFNLSDKKLSSYPILEERKKIITNSSNRMSALFDLYELGIASLLSNEYDIAIDLFTIIEQEKFKSKEIYNNLGLSYFLKALSIDEKDTLRLKYPLQIDFNTNLSQSRGSFNDDFDELINKSIICYNNALKMDKHYAKVLLNKTILELHTNSEEFKVSLFKLKNTNTVDPNHIELLEILREIKTSEFKKALKKLKKLSKSDNIALHNFKKITEKKKAIENYSSEQISGNNSNLELINKISKHHAFFTNSDQATTNAKAFRSHLRYTKLKAFKSILDDNKVKSIKFSRNNEFHVIYDQSILNSINPPNIDTDLKILYLQHKQFVLKYIDNKLVCAFLII